MIKSLKHEDKNRYPFLKKDVPFYFYCFWNPVLLGTGLLLSTGVHPRLKEADCKLIQATEKWSRNPLMFLWFLGVQKKRRKIMFM